MMAGELYAPADPELVALHRRAMRLCRVFNQTPAEEPERQRAVLEDLFDAFGEKSEIVAPFQCDYGVNIRLGRGVFVNFNAVFLDCNWITIGDHTMLGPAVQVYAADHPRDAKTRSSGRELGRPITIGRHVWIGGGSIICPGVSIGDNTTIGAGSVVTRDIPANVVAAGNPCRVLRTLDPAGAGP